MKTSVHPTNNEISESEAILLAQQGDAAAFEVLYRMHSRRVFAICLRMSVERSEAEDLTQETFLMIFRKIQSFRGESAFSTWVHRVAVNTWIRETDALDGLVDFDAAIRDPAIPTQMATVYDCGDGLHPSDLGYCKLGDAIDLALFD